MRLPPRGGRRRRWTRAPAERAPRPGRRAGSAGVGVLDEDDDGRRRRSRRCTASRRRRRRSPRRVPASGSRPRRLAEADLLGPDADRDLAGAAARASDARSRRPSSSRTASGAGDRAVEQVGDAEEAGDEGGRGPLVELGRRAELLDPAAVHDRDRVGHRHRLLLVVRDVDEGDARCRAGSPSARAASACAASGRARRAARRGAAPAGRLTSARASATRCCWPPESWRGLRVAEPLEPDEPQHLVDAALQPAPVTPLRRSPKATFSKTVRCGKSA